MVGAGKHAQVVANVELAAPSSGALVALDTVELAVLSAVGAAVQSNAEQAGEHTAVLVVKSSAELLAVENVVRSR
jgi:hypothetical protein